MDVLSASQDDSKIAWYENLGGGLFGDQQIISVLAEGPQSVYAVDLDGDGDIDVLSASYFDHKIAWYENMSIAVTLEELQVNIINLFPNPMTTLAMINLGELRGPIQLEIYDILGKLQRPERLNLESGTLMIERGTLSKGTYILRLTHENEALELKFVVE